MLANVFPKYEHRPGQLQMATLTRQTLQDEGVALIEAPTGTGKTIAYLAPALTSGRRVMISTGTKALQAQIVAKDVPLVEQALGRRVDAVAMKGRRNYLCRRRLRQFLQQPTFATRQEAALFDRVTAWSERTETGDREEIEGLPDGLQFWNDLSADAESCAGAHCPGQGDCFITKLRARAAKADLVIVNHHLLFADLAVRAATAGEAQALPPYEAVICDEAHQIEDTATSYFGKVASSFRFEEWERDLGRALAAVKQTPDAELRGQLAELHATWESLFKALRTLKLRDERLRPANCTAEMEETALRLQSLGERIAARLESVAAQTPSPDLPLLTMRLKELARTTDEVLAADDPAFVYWREIRPRTTLAHKDPIDLAGPMQDTLFAFARAVVFTSATLATQGHFRFVRSRLGIDFEAAEAVLPTCFDYQRQALFYAPDDLPDPRDARFLEAAIERLAALVEAAGGGSLCLFTSVRNMEAAFERLSGRLPYPCLLQGQAPKSHLLDRKRREPDSVLFATASFWEGVDVAGDALRCVVIDKLPFASPGEPIVAARIEKIEADGGEPFKDYQLPAAIIALKQGLGRLIRTADDRGVLALLDSRLHSKAYGKIILRSLPPFPLTKRLEDVEAYWRGVGG